MPSRRSVGSKTKKLPVLTAPRELVPCLSCGSCCKYVAVGIDGPTSIRAASEILWQLYHENVSVFRDGDGEWLVQLDARCRNLGDDNKCAIYEHRPLICRQHSEKSCEVNAEGNDGTTFRTPEEFTRYLEAKHPRVFALLLKKGYLPPAAATSARPRTRRAAKVVRSSTAR
jgi:Fe-S-cluster containining protein